MERLELGTNLQSNLAVVVVGNLDAQSGAVELVGEVGSFDAGLRKRALDETRGIHIDLFALSGCAPSAVDVLDVLGCAEEELALNFPVHAADDAEMRSHVRVKLDVVAEVLRVEVLVFELTRHGVSGVWVCC